MLETVSLVSNVFSIVAGEARVVCVIVGALLHYTETHNGYTFQCKKMVALMSCDSAVNTLGRAKTILVLTEG